MSLEDRNLKMESLEQTTIGDFGSIIFTFVVELIPNSLASLEISVGP